MKRFLATVCATLWVLPSALYAQGLGASQLILTNSSGGGVILQPNPAASSVITYTLPADLTAGTLVSGGRILQSDGQWEPVVAQSDGVGGGDGMGADGQQWDGPGGELPWDDGCTAAGHSHGQHRAGAHVTATGMSCCRTRRLGHRRRCCGCWGATVEQGRRRWSLQAGSEQAGSGSETCCSGETMAETRLGLFGPRGVLCWSMIHQQQGRLSLQ
jgi:hypothetical protein